MSDTKYIEKIAEVLKEAQAIKTQMLQSNKTAPLESDLSHLTTFVKHFKRNAYEQWFDAVIPNYSAIKDSYYQLSFNFPNPDYANDLDMINTIVTELQSMLDLLDIDKKKSA